MKRTVEMNICPACLHRSFSMPQDKNQKYVHKNVLEIICIDCYNKEIKKQRQTKKKVEVKNQHIDLYLF
jgi:Zn ribbon nucleic-acid-binding protein